MERLKTYFNMVNHNLFGQQLQRYSDHFVLQMRDQAAGIQQAMKNEFYEFMDHCFKLLKRICNLLDKGGCFMHDKGGGASIEFYEDNEKVKLSLKTAFTFNI